VCDDEELMSVLDISNESISNISSNDSDNVC
jgi:hypothetical protein